MGKHAQEISNGKPLLRLDGTVIKDVNNNTVADASILSKLSEVNGGLAYSGKGLTPTPTASNTIFKLDLLGDGSCVECFPLVDSADGLSGDYTGTLIGGYFVPNSVFGAGYYYSSDTGYINMNVLTAILNNKTNISFSIWVKGEKSAPNARCSPFVGYSNTSDETGYQYLWDKDQFTGEWNTQNGVGSVTTFSFSKADFKEWHNETTTFDGADVKFYIDGILKSTSSRAGNTNIATGASLARSQPSENEQFIGGLCQFRIFNKTLTEAEIQTKIMTEVY